MIAAVVNATLFTGLTVGIGAIALRWVMVGRAGLPAGARAHVLRDAATAGTWASVLILVAACGRAASQAQALTFPGDPWLPMVRVVVLETSLGTALRFQAIGGLAALAGFAAARNDRARGWTVAGLASLLLAATPGFVGHPAAAEEPALALTAATVHVLGAGAWIGGLFHLWRSGREARGGAGTFGPLLSSFHAVALWGAAALAVTGAYHTWTLVGLPTDLPASGWGRLLIAKLSLLVVVVALGARHWSTAARKVAGGEGVSVRRSLAVELAFAAAVIAVTSVLVGTSPPE